MHGELEAALQSMKSQLEATESELDKQRALNEKLETDLLQMDQRKGDVGGGASPANGTSTPVDVLAGLELGKKPGVSLLATESAQFRTNEMMNLRNHQRGIHLYHSHPQQIPPSCRS